MHDDVVTLLAWAFVGTVAGMALGGVELPKYQDGLILTWVGLIGGVVYIVNFRPWLSKRRLERITKSIKGDERKTSKGASSRAVPHRDTPVQISSRDYWFKIVEMLQQNWALIDNNSDGGCTVFFLGDTSGVFDRLLFPSHSEAERALRRNGFGKFSEAKKDTQKVIAIPQPPFYEWQHPNGPIYSSGRFWR
jgi:hypothetical protein